MKDNFKLFDVQVIPFDIWFFAFENLTNSKHSFIALLIIYLLFMFLKPSQNLKNKKVYIYI